MITLAPKYFKCRHTHEPAEFVVLEKPPGADPLDYLISPSAKVKFYGNLLQYPVVKWSPKIRSAEILDQLAKLNLPVFSLVHEGAGKDVALRVKFAQEIINLCMPVAPRTVLLFYYNAKEETGAFPPLDEVKDQLWELFVKETKLRLALKRKKFSIIWNYGDREVKTICDCFWEMLKALYKDLYDAIKRKEVILI